MQLALRPYVTTGIALVGASVIAISPISPVAPDIQVPSISTSSVAVQLTGAINPIGDPFSAWANVAMNTVDSLAVLGGQVLGSGLPVLSQVLANQVGYLQLIGKTIETTISGLQAWPHTTLPGYWDYARDLYEAGQVGEALKWYVYGAFSVTFAFMPLLGPLNIPGTIARNFANVVNQLVPAVMAVGLSAINVIQDPLAALGPQLQAFIDSVKAGDPLSAVNAVLNTPAAMVDAFLNGFEASQGLLGPYVSPLSSGTLAALLIRIPQLIAEAIRPPAPSVAPAAVESAPDTLVADASSISSTAISAIGGAGTITLSPATETPAEETPATDTPVEGTPAAETPVEETPAAETPVEETPVAETPVEETPVEETPAAETPVEETPVVDTEPVLDTEPATLVRDSVQAKPGQLGLTKASEAGANLAKSARGEISKVANKINEGIKKAFGKPAKKAAAESNAGSSDD